MRSKSESTSKKMRTYEVRIPCISNDVGSVTATTPGKAKYKVWLDIVDAWNFLKFTDIKVRLCKMNNNKHLEE